MKNILTFFLVFLPFITNAQNWLWAKGSTGSTANRTTSSIADAVGNIYITGTFYSPSITFGSITLHKLSSGLQRDIFITKYSPEGAVVWARNFVNGGNNQASANPILEIDHSGGLYLTGMFDTTSITFGSTVLNSTFAYRHEMYLVKLDTAGGVIWAKDVDGTGIMQINDLKADNSGNVYVTGYLSGNGLTSIFETDTIRHHAIYEPQLFIAKYRGDGSLHWAKTSSPGDSSSQGYSISITKNGNCMLTGMFSGPSIVFGSDTLTNAGIDERDIFVTVYDSLGNSVWAKRYGGASEEWAKTTNIDSTGSFYLYGQLVNSPATFGSITLSVGCCWNMFVARCDSAGNVLWAKKKNSYIFVPSAFSDSSGNLYIGGQTTSFDSFSFEGHKTAGGYNNLFVVKYNNTGTIQWAIGADTSFNGTSGRYISSITANMQGDIYACGRFTTPKITLGPTTLTNDSTFDNFFLAKLSTSVGPYSPHFLNGDFETISVCEGSGPFSIDSQLAVIDSNLATTVTWSVLEGASHGVLSISYSTLTTTGTLVPIGLSYTPTTGYHGTDTFRVKVNDGSTSDSITIFVTIDSIPVIASITGANTVCSGATISLANITPGGYWSSSSPTNATVDTAGVVSGISAGSAIISYSIPSSCAMNFVTDTITIMGLPDPGTVVGADSICVGATSSFSNSVAGGTWSIYHSFATISGGIVTGLLAGIDTVSYTVYNACGSNSAIKRVTIITLPEIDTIYGASEVMTEYSISLSHSTAGGVWYSNDTLIATVDSMGIVLGILPGTCSIGYVVTNSCGSDTATVNIVVSAWPEKPMTEIENYPNPSKGLVTLKINAPYTEPANIKITNVTGGVVKNIETMTNKTTKVFLESGGIFFLNVFSTHVSEIVKVMIEK